jgi:hypothetical protein
MPSTQPYEIPPGASLQRTTKDVAAVAATSTFAILAASAACGQRHRVMRAQLLVDTTYAADASNFYVFTLVHNGTTVATWSTQTSAQGALTAGANQEMILAADTGVNLVVQPGELLQLVCTKNGTAANFTGRVCVGGRDV